MDEDLRLIERYIAGDAEAVEDLVLKYQKQIYAVLCRMMGNTEDAKDLTQTAFVRAMEGLRGFRGESSFKTWLYRIAINHCINHVKKHAQEFVEVTEHTGSVHPSIQKQLEDREQREHFRRLVKRLPPKQKAIMELRINEQLSYDEIARISGRSVSTIKASVFFALEKLRKLVKDPRIKA